MYSIIIKCTFSEFVSLSVFRFEIFSSIYCDDCNFVSFWMLFLLRCSAEMNSKYSLLSLLSLLLMVVVEHIHSHADTHRYTSCHNTPREKTKTILFFPFLLSTEWNSRCDYRRGTSTAEIFADWILKNPYRWLRSSKTEADTSIYELNELMCFFFALSSSLFDAHSLIVVYFYCYYLYHVCVCVLFLLFYFFLKFYLFRFSKGQPEQ